jgi:hypothetical protein
VWCSMIRPITDWLRAYFRREYGKRLADRYFN